MEPLNEKVKEYIRLYTEANYPIRDIAKQCKTFSLHRIQRNGRRRIYII